MTTADLPNLDHLSPGAREIVRRTQEQLERYPQAEVTEVPDDGDYDHRLIDERLINAQVCSRLSATEAAAWLTTVRPPGTSHNVWVPAEDVAPVACEQFPATHRHFIVEC